MKYFLATTLVLLFSCDKNIQDDYLEESRSEKYAGLYEMYDPIKNENYEMKISAFNGESQYSNSNWDSVSFENFGNKFNFSDGIAGFDGVMSGVIISPLEDDMGVRWNFSNNHYPDTLNRINVLLGDSIYIYMNYDNTAYWMEDGVSYESVESVHRGKKIH